jgi:hypothetical protein
MTMRRIVVAALSALALSACVVERPIHDRLTLDFTDPDSQRVRITAETTFPEYPRRPPRAMAHRLDAAREAIVAGRDEWGVRFANVAPENERVVFDRHRGAVSRAEHSATIDRDDLPKFFADMPVTVHLTRENGFSELAIYPATSTRATREEREHFERTMHFWSEALAHYFMKMNALYGYMDAHPLRAHIVFAALLEDDPDLLLTEDEKALVNTAGDAISDVMSRVEATEDQAYTLTEEADRIFQPLNVDVVVQLPRAPSAGEGFERHETSVTITRPSLLDAVTKLEGRWLSPDPLTMRLRDPKNEQHWDASGIAAQPRHSVAVVTATEIEEAVTTQLQPLPAYRVRWRD